MPDYTWIGAGLATIEQVNAVVTLDELGVADATLEFTTNWDTAVAYAQTRVTHPDFSWLRRYQATVKREEANMGRVSVKFRGISPEYASQTQRSYSLEACVSSEPIETHPDFETFAGTVDAPLNGAMFDTDPESDTYGEFRGFSSRDQSTDPNLRKCGVSSFLSPGVILTEVIVRPYTSTTGYSPSRPSSLTGLGCIETPPTTTLLPSIHGSRTWLLVSSTVEDLGNGTRELRRWRLSGPRGWDRDIYKTSSVNQG